MQVRLVPFFVRLTCFLTSLVSDTIVIDQLQNTPDSFDSALQFLYPRLGRYFLAPPCAPAKPAYQATTLRLPPAQGSALL